MNEHDDLERILARWFDAEAVEPAPADRFQQAVAATREHRPRPAMLAGLGSAWVQPGSVAGVQRFSLITVVLLALLILALAAGALIVGGLQRRFPVVVPAGDGLIAYASGGDIYVGDPATGETRDILPGPQRDSSPIFSPDGTRLAFLRGDRETEDASIVVVRADGSNERVAMQPGFSQRGVGFTWTPDGASILLNHDSRPFTTPYFDGELSLLDATGVDEPRLITPPLPIGPGGGYFGNVEVAPMFRPPNADLILSSATGPASAAAAGSLERLYAWDADLVTRTELTIDGLERYRPYYFQPWALWWSPDGSMIAFELGWGDREPFEIGTFVMHADGTAVRPLEGVEGGVAWSPDGSKIAYQRGCPDPSRQGAVVVVHDLASGAERVLEATAVETKYEGDVSPLPPGTTAGCFGGWFSGPEGRAWDYEGWSWSPDGRRIVMLERSGTRPLVVDVQTGEATELPWEANSAPSWRLAPLADSE